MNTTKTRLIILCLTIPLIWLTSCNEEETVTISELISVTSELPGDNCSFGGTRIATGTDDNDDGTLSEDEIDDVQYICQNPNHLATVSQESAGENCPSGGIRIATGPDSDGDGILDTDEVTQVEFICNNVSSMVRTREETAGENCEYGGIAILEGQDSDGDGNLSEAETTSIQYVCNSPNTLIETTQESPGANCTNGGVRVTSGIDTNGDQVLSAEEITSVEYFCNALSSLVTTSDEPAGSNCSVGGIRIDIGTDDNANGILESGEIDETQYVCNGSTVGGDLLVRLEIGKIGLSNNSIRTTGISFVEYREDRDRLTNFSKLDYPGVDSIVYAVPMRTSDRAYSCFVELYDATNNASVVTLQTNHEDHDGIYETVYSGNIYDLLPGDGTRIDLANRIASEEFGNTVYAGLPAQLLLFRRN